MGDTVILQILFISIFLVAVAIKLLDLVAESYFLLPKTWRRRLEKLFRRS